LQLGFARVLSGNIIGAEIRREMNVSTRIPDIVIRSVEDADKVWGALLEQSFQAAAIFGSENLLRIGRANRCQSVAVSDPGLDE
jgi:hypothetical protein